MRPSVLQGGVERFQSHPEKIQKRPAIVGKAQNSGEEDLVNGREGASKYPKPNSYAKGDGRREKQLVSSETGRAGKKKEGDRSVRGVFKRFTL